MIGAIFGILAALLIGLSDLFGRQVTAKSSAITASSTMQAFGAASVLISLVFWPGTFSASDLALGALSGVGFAVGLSSYYLGLTRASSAVVAPLAAVLSALIPFGWIVVGGTDVSLLSTIGVALALVGLIAVTTDAPKTALSKAGIQLGVLAGVGYGIGQALLLEVATTSGPVAIAGQRVIAFGLMIPLAAATKNRVLAPIGTRNWGIAAGICAGGASVALFQGLRFDPVAAVIGISLFPVFSVIVGRIRYLDTLTKRQVVGIVCAVLGTAGVVAG